MGSHIYKSHWLVLDCRYEVLLEFWRHENFRQTVDYVKRILRTTRVRKCTEGSRSKKGNSFWWGDKPDCWKLLSNVDMKTTMQFRSFVCFTKRWVEDWRTKRKPDLQQDIFLKSADFIFRPEQFHWLSLKNCTVHVIGGPWCGGWENNSSCFITDCTNLELEKVQPTKNRNPAAQREDQKIYVTVWYPTEYAEKINSKRRLVNYQALRKMMIGNDRTNSTMGGIFDILGILKCF